VSQEFVLALALFTEGMLQTLMVVHFKLSFIKAIDLRCLQVDMRSPNRNLEHLGRTSGKEDSAFQIVATINGARGPRDIGVRPSTRVYASVRMLGRTGKLLVGWFRCDQIPNWTGLYSELDDPILRNRRSKH
jgi:hypothetical protein